MTKSSLLLLLLHLLTRTEKPHMPLGYCELRGKDPATSVFLVLYISVWLIAFHAFLRDLPSSFSLGPPSSYSSHYHGERNELKWMSQQWLTLEAQKKERAEITGPLKRVPIEHHMERVEVGRGTNTRELSLHCGKAHISHWKPLENWEFEVILYHLDTWISLTIFQHYIFLLPPSQGWDPAPDHLGIQLTSQSLLGEAHSVGWGKVFTLSSEGYYQKLFLSSLLTNKSGKWSVVHEGIKPAEKTYTLPVILERKDKSRLRKISFFQATQHMLAYGRERFQFILNKGNTESSDVCSMNGMILFSVLSGISEFTARLQM